MVEIDGAPVAEGGGVLSFVAGALQAVQSWPAFAKSVLSVAIIAAGGTAIVAVWQKPSEVDKTPKSAKAASVKAVANAAVATQSGSRNLQVTQGGERNSQTTVEGHHNVLSPHTQNFEAPVGQAGTIVSTGQSGGQSGIIYNQAPPVTERQKEEALASLEAQLGEFSQFPDNIPADPQTMSEQIIVDKRPIKLYNLLKPFYASTINAAPDQGAYLYQFKQNFYSWRNSASSFEELLVPRIGTMVQVRFAAGWLIYLRYFLLRAYGATQAQVESWGNFLNYDITWDEAERVYVALSKDGEIGSRASVIITSYAKLIAVSDAVLAHGRQAHS